MMPSRKRRNSPYSTPPTRPSKRPKLPPRTSRSKGRKRDPGRDQANGADPERLYEIKDILDEKGGKYRIDWEGIDPNTGKRYKPTWEPKENVTPDAVAAWERIKIRRKPTEQVRKKSLRVPSSGASEDFSSNPSISLKQIPQEAFSAPLSLLDCHQEKRGQEPREVDRPISTPTIAKLPQVAVNVSPLHSSFDRDQYLAYQSSQSAQGLPSSNEKLSSGVTDWPSAQSIPAHVIPYQTGVVPDSQPLPGSSSYALTCSGSATESSLFRSHQEHNNSSVRDTRDSSIASFFPTSAGELSDPIEDFSSPVTIVDKDSAEHSKTSRSVPVHSPNKGSILSLATFLPSALNTSKFDHHERAKTNPSHRTVSRLGASKGPEQRAKFTFSSAFQPLAQGISSLVAIRNSFSKARSLSSNQSPTPKNSSEKATSNEQDTEFRTQVSLPESWQSAQRAACPSGVESQQSSGDPEVFASQPIPPEDHNSSLKDPLEGVESQSKGLESSASSREEKEALRRSQETKSSILSHRDPNSQRERNFSLGQFQKDIVIASIESNDVTIIEISNSLAFAPSHVSPVLESRAQPRRATPFQESLSGHSRMASSPPLVSEPRALSSTPTGMSLGDRLRKMRADSAAGATNQKASREPSLTTRDSKSPSVIPKPQTQEGVGDSRLEVQPLEVPVSIPVTQPPSQPASHAPLHPSKLSLHKEMSVTPAAKLLDLSQLGPMEFAVSLPMHSRVRDQYKRAVNLYADEIAKFVKESCSNDSLVEPNQKMVDRVNNICIHTDLDNFGTPTQEDAGPGEVASWAVRCSSKFAFLKHLIDAMRDQDHHISIIAQAGKRLDTIEAFLKASHVVYDRPDNFSRSSPDNTQGNLQFSLIASGVEGSSALPKAASGVIAFDGSFNARDHQITALRRHIFNVDQLSPVIHLLVHSSAEHIERCLPSSMTGLERLRAAVSYVTQTRLDVGVLVEEDPSPEDAAKMVATFIEAGGGEGQWALPQMRALEVLEILESSQDKSTTRLETQTTEGQIFAQSPATLKRPADDLREENAKTKRQRITPLAEISHVSDSAMQEPSMSQTILDLRTNLENAESELATLKASSVNRISYLENTLNTTKQHLQEHTEALSALQSRFESRTRKFHALRHEKDDLIAAAATSERKREAQANEVASLQEERKRLETELHEAREALRNSTIPEIAQFEQAKTEAQIVAQAKALLERKVASMTQDFEFTRQQYQVASSAAADSTSRVAELETEVALLRQKASGETARLKEVSNKKEMATHLARIAELESMLEEREELLKRREEARRGRGMQTRANSAQPRSPRLGNSRTASPMPGTVLGFRKGGFRLE